MKVLGLDTSAALASVAVVEDGELVIELAQDSNENQMGAGVPGSANHSASLLCLIESALRERNLQFADLTAIGVSIGPGSFTGLRVGLSVAKGLVYGSDVPLFGIRTLEAMARRVPWQENETFICPIMDARKGQVYAALYQREAHRYAAVMNDTVDTLPKVLERVNALVRADCLFLGEATRVYGELIERTMGARAKLAGAEGYPSTASAVARIAGERAKKGGPEPLRTLAPHYLRPPDAVPPKPKV